MSGPVVENLVSINSFISPRRGAVIEHYVIADLHRIRVRIRASVGGDLCDEVLTGDDDPGVIVPGDYIVLDNDFIAGHDDDPATCRDLRYQRAWDAEVRGVVIDNEIATNDRVVRAFDRQAGCDEYQNTAGIVLGEVPLDQHMAAVFDLDGDVVEHLTVAHIDVVAHAHVDGRILDAREDVVSIKPFSPNSGKMP